MTLEQLVGWLALPERCRVNQRVPKKLLLENETRTASDKSLIQDSIEELFWVAALKPDTIGVPAYRHDNRDYQELAVLTANLRGPASPRLAELVHRAIPYPVLLIMAAPGMVGAPYLSATVSLAHIRHAKREADRTVLDGSIILVPVQNSAIGQAFSQALALQHQPCAHMLDLYQGWIDTTTALQVAELTGQFTPSASPEAAAAQRTALQQCHDLKARIVQLRAQASKEKQLPRQVTLNLEIRMENSTLDQLMASLSHSAP